MANKRAATPINLRNQHFQNAGRWARDRARGPHFENVDFEGIGLMAATPLINLRNQHFQNAGRGPGTGPSGPHFENVDFEGGNY